MSSGRLMNGMLQMFEQIDRERVAEEEKAEQNREWKKRIEAEKAARVKELAHLKAEAERKERQVATERREAFAAAKAKVTIAALKDYYVSEAGRFNASSKIFTSYYTSLDIIISRLFQRAKADPKGASWKTLDHFDLWNLHVPIKGQLIRYDIYFGSTKRPQISPIQEWLAQRQAERDKKIAERDAERHEEYLAAKKKVTVAELKAYYDFKATFFNASSRVFIFNDDLDATIDMLYWRAKRDPIRGTAWKTLNHFDLWDTHYPTHNGMVRYDNFPANRLKR